MLKEKAQNLGHKDDERKQQKSNEKVNVIRYNIMTVITANEALSYSIDAFTHCDCHLL